MPATPEAQYNAAFEWYRKTPGKNSQLERVYNHGYTKDRLNDLLYELKKAHNISETDIQLYLSSIAKKEVSVIEEVGASPVIPPVVVVEGQGSVVPPASPAVENNPDPILVPETNVPPVTPSDAGEADAGAEAVIENKKMREEFPFLNEPDCPEVFFVVVGKKISAWNAYQVAHKQLQDADSGLATLLEEERAKITKIAVENFEENQALYDELHYYQQNKAILGNHTLFKDFRINRAREEAKAKVEAMSGEDLQKYVGSSKTFLSRKKKEIAAAEKAGDVKEVAALIESRDLRQYELELVNKRLAAL